MLIQLFTVTPARTGQYLQTTKFNEMVTERLGLWPYAVNRDYSQAVKLISILGERGWHHELHYPCYIWADTQGLWRPTSLVQIPGQNINKISGEEFSKAIEKLETLETRPGQWVTMDELAPFPSRKQLRDFPVAVSFLDPNTTTPVASSLDPEEVMAVLAPLFS